MRDQNLLALDVTNMPGLEVFTDGIVPLPLSQSIYFGWFTAITQTIGLGANVLTFIANVRQPGTESTRLLLTMTAGDILFGITALVFVTSAVENGGYALGIIGCVVNATLLMITASVSVVTLALVALERYLSVVKGVHMTERMVIRWIAGVWIYSFFIATLPFLLRSEMQSIRLEETNMSCLIKWYARDVPTLIISSISVFVMLSANNGILFCYTNVYFTFVKVLGQRRQMVDFIKKERKIFKMCLAMTGSFTLLWTPVFAGIIYEFISGNPIHPLYSHIAGSLGCLAPTMNPFLLYYFDNRIRTNVKEFLGGKLGRRESSLRNRTITREEACGSPQTPQAPPGSAASATLN
jgi:hypothetical protein